MHDTPSHTARHHNRSPEPLFERLFKSLFERVKQTTHAMQELFFEQFRNRVYPPTFLEEINEQCRIFFPLYSAPFFVAWLPYLALDAQIIPNEPLLPVLRVGLTVVGIAAIALRAFWKHPDRHRYIVLIMLYYLIIATGVITGLSKAHPSYIGGYCFLITVLGAVPVQLRHLYTSLALSLTTFGALCWQQGITFSTPTLRYSLQDLFSTVAVNGILSFGWMILRRNSYEKARALQEANLRMTEQQHTLEAQYVALQELDNEKDELLGIVSHDLKNPLTHVLGVTEILHQQQYNVSDEERQRFLSLIHEAATSMQRLIQRLLDVNALENGSITASLVDINLYYVADGIIREYEQPAAAKNIRIELMGDRTSIVRADEVFLKQIVDNLLSNALKYSPHNTHVRLSVVTEPAALAQHQRQAGFVVAERRTLLMVQDEGPGLSDHDKSRLFTKFARLSAKPTGGERSTGLGLSIVKKLAEMMDARVWVESEIGRGSVFVAEFPNGTAPAE